MKRFEIYTCDPNIMGFSYILISTKSIRYNEIINNYVLEKIFESDLRNDCFKHLQKQDIREDLYLEVYV